MMRFESQWPLFIWTGTLSYYKILFDDEGELDWPKFCDRLHELENFTGELVKLVQSGSVHDYEVQF